MAADQEHLTLNNRVKFCPVDRRHRDINIDVASILSIFTVVGTAFIAGLALWTFTAPPPSVLINYNHSHLLSNPIITRADLSDASLPTYKKGTYYNYVELCLENSIGLGRLSSQLERGNERTALNTLTVSLPDGCYNLSIPVEIPRDLKDSTYTIKTYLHGNPSAVRSYIIQLSELTAKIK